MKEKMHPIYIGIAWCLAWGEGKKPKHDLNILQQMQQALNDGKEVPEEVSYVVDAVRELEKLEEPEKFPQTLEELKKLTEKNPLLWNSKIGLVYGGATKIKQYVFEESKLPDIRGASARLDQINLVDLPAFFNQKPENLYKFYSQDVQSWLNKNFPCLSQALISELIIYSCGGNILAFCPSAFVDVLANAIEKRYTNQTLTANSCAVGDTFRILELRLGLLRENINDTFWLKQYREKYSDSFVEGCFGKVDNVSKIDENFQNRKSFNELTTKLAIAFNQRRSGNYSENRPSRCYPPMLETHPYLRRDEAEKRSAITKAINLPGEPYFSEPTAIKRQFGDRAKNGEARGREWYQGDAQTCKSWVNKFENFLENNLEQQHIYFRNCNPELVEIPESLTQLSKVSKGYIAYIYADGNNMGGFIQKIRTVKEYQNFSQDVDNATKYAMYQALAANLQPRELQGIDESTSTLKNGDLIHPFEIITIGGDDIILIVPADKALEIAKTIGEQFENILLGEAEIKDVKIKGNYELEEKAADLKKCHRYDWHKAKQSRCKLSISSGVLITAYNTPIYYAEQLATQLLKSAKNRAKNLKNKKLAGYQGGTVDFLVMKSVTMISSNIEEFRKQALVKEVKAKLKLYAAPYTLHELEGLLKAISALKQAKFPKSQLYQIRSFLERGKHTAILNYRYFRVRLKQGSITLKEEFEDVWCQPKDPNNKGNLAPWMHNSGEIDNPESPEPFYETIWREMVDLYDLIDTSDVESLQDLLQEVDS